MTYKPDHKETGNALPAILVGMTTLLLLLLHFLPALHIGNHELRPVSILSDLTDRAATANQPGDNHAAADTSAVPWPDGTQPIIDHSQGEAGGMAHFYDMLDSLSRGKLTERPLRIALYADSYTEADILAADLRELLQAKYGGAGVGWIDAGNNTNVFRLSVGITEHGLTERMAMQKDGYDAHQAGLAARYAPFAGSASATFKGRSTYPHAETWQTVRTYLRPRSNVSVTLDGAPNQTLSGTGIKEAAFSLARPTNQSTVSLSGSGTAFGISLEAPTGIVFDNFSMRSSSGLPLSALSDEMLQQFQALRHYDLVILAFGGNVASTTGKADECEWYAKHMVKVIDKVKNDFEGASILVMSTPDKGARSGNAIITPESVSGLVTIQNQMAADCHVAFYDLLSAMGGQGAAGRLHEKKMVRDDLFHINQEGGAYIAERIMRSITAGVERNRRK